MSTLSPGSSSQRHLTNMLRAIRSYFHPANINNSSDQLHGFISSLCTHFIDRLHLERHNKKWETKIPMEVRLKEKDIKEFVSAVLPIAWLVLYNNYEDEARSVFSSLALISPDTVIPRLLQQMSSSADIITEPHRLHVCIQAVSAVATSVVTNFPKRAFELLHSLVPAIDVNDIWRSTDICICMSDLLETQSVSSPAPLPGLEDDTSSTISHNFEDFVSELLSKCFTLIENSKRENIRNDGTATDDYLNDEEIAADAAINETFLKLCINSSPEILTDIFNKLRVYITGRIVEPTVAGGILASMCRSAVQCSPVQGLQVFMPLLVPTILARLRDRQADTDKQDEELQFNLQVLKSDMRNLVINKYFCFQLLGEVLSCTNVGIFRSEGSHVMPWLDKICSVLDETLHLKLKDEYELAHTVLQMLLTWLCRVRILETRPRLRPGSEAMVRLAEVEMEWYVPGQEELAAVHSLLSSYLAPVMERLQQFAEGNITLDKETLQRNLKLLNKILIGISDMIEPETVSDKKENSLSQNMSWLDNLNIKIGGESVRKIVRQLLSSVQRKLITDRSDDTDSITGIIYVYDMLLFSFGLDEDDIGDHIEDHKREKLHRENRLVRSKIHLPGVHIDRVCLQWETHLWLKNLLCLETLPRELMEDVLELCTHRYSEVRIAAQELLLKMTARLGPASHSLVVPYLVKCLQDNDNLDIEEKESKLKGALYIIYSEKHMFYSWETANTLWPALVTAQHSDKQSVDDLLRDISIKANRYYQDFILYTLPLSSPSMPAWLPDMVRNNLSQTGPGTGALTEHKSITQVVHYQELETKLVKLVESNNLHWRHQEMGVGMLLSMIIYDHSPSLDTTQLWLSLLISDQRQLRLMAYQALEGILKLTKLPSVKVPLSDLVPDHDTVNVSRPGVRGDNQCLQYKSDMTETELQSYWNSPFIVKSYIGYNSWPSKGCRDVARKNHTAEHFTFQPDSIRGLVAQFFNEENRMKTFVEFNSLEYEKGQDFFSTDRGLFLSFLLENLGPCLSGVFQPHIERLVSSPEESQQRAAAEMVYGLVRGSRFWDWDSSSQLWAWLLPVFRQVLNNVTTETQSDWDFCFSGATNKADPNRLRWLYELLVTPENLMSQGSFKESSFLLFVGKCLSMNWRVQELYCRTYNIIREHWDHPYNNVRHQIAATLATLTNMDIQWAGIEGGNIGQGFPSKKLFIDEVTPLLTLNCPNPEFRLSRSLSPNSSLNTSHSSSEDVSMASMDTGEDEESKRGKRILEMVSLWVCHTIRLSSTTVDPVMYELLPYMCQYIGTESDQDVSQSCLQALSYLSVCIVPATAIPPLLHMITRCSTSTSYKTKLSVMEFLQTVVFTNFPSFVSNNKHRTSVTSFVTSLLTDTHITVRQKAAKILGGLLHSGDNIPSVRFVLHHFSPSGFVSEEALTELLSELRGRVRTKMTRRGKRKFKKDSSTETVTGSQQDNLVLVHSGILGLCSFVEGEE